MYFTPIANFFGFCIGFNQLLFASPSILSAAPKQEAMPPVPIVATH